MARERKAPASCVLISQGEVSNDNEFYYIVEGRWRALPDRKSVV